MMKKKICFFTTVKAENILFENYTLLDIKILKELGYEVIIAHSFCQIPNNCDLYYSWWASGSIFPLIKALLFRKPNITVAGGNEAMFYRDSISKKPAGYLNYSIFKKLAVRFVLQFSKLVLVVSDFMLNDVKSLGAKNIERVYNCVNVDYFKPDVSVQRIYITTIFKQDHDVVRIKRGINYLMAVKEVVSIFPDQKFIIIGRKGNAYNVLLELCTDLNILNNVIFVDEILPEDVLTFFQKTKLYVQISDTETFGLSIAEAMSTGVTVLVSRAGAIPEVVGDLGIFVDHNDVNSISNGIISFLKCNNLYVTQIGENSRNRILEKFSYQNRKIKIENILNKIC
jgi:glycosyltransferase involved in cell wall biosynthesis